jgi:hypothetical protein
MCVARIKKTVAALGFGSILLLSACKGSFLQKWMDDTVPKKEGPVVVTQPPPPPPAAPLPPPVAPPESIPTAPGVPPPQEAGDVQTIEEINGYVECLNRTMSRTQDSYNRYLSWVDPKAGPSCKERYVMYSLYTLYSDGIEKCQKAAKRGAEAPPALPVLEKAAADLATAYAQLVTLTQTADDYYRQEDYKDDNCAKGKTLHPQLMDAFGRYMAAAEVLEKDLDVRKTDLEQKELARLEQQSGRKLEWQIRNFMRTARLLMNAVPKKDPAQFNSQAYLSAFDQLQKDYDGMVAYAQANAAEAQGAFWYSAYESSAKNFYTQAKFLKRDVAEGKKPDGQKLNQLVNEFNRLVGDSNNLRFR